MRAFRFQRIEFPIVLLGGLLLAGIAGYVNTLVITLGSPPVTHLTGTISRLSSDMGNGDLQDARFVLMLVGSFLLGAICSGVLIGSSTLRIGRRYGVAILVESVLLGLAALLYEHSDLVAILLIAGAAGLQNAMAASYRSMIIRTTHLTGVITDMGFHIGQFVSGHRTEAWPFLLHGAIIGAFLSGGILGVLSSKTAGSSALWYPAILLAVCGVGYFLIRLIVQSKRSGSVNPDG